MQKKEELDSQLGQLNSSIETDEIINYQPIMIEVILALKKINQIQTARAETLIDAHHRQINPRLSTLDRLAQEIRAIKSKLQPPSIYKLMSTQS